MKLEKDYPKSGLGIYHHFAVIIFAFTSLEFERQRQKEISNQEDYQLVLLEND